MNISLPHQILQASIDAGIIQNTGSVNSTEGRSDQAKRLTMMVGEYVVGKVNMALNATKRLK